MSIGATPDEMREFRFTQPFRIGRVKECEVYIDSRYVSRSHAEVVLEDGVWWIRDLGSSNGIFIDNGRIERAPILDAVSVRLGIHGPEVRLEVEEIPRLEKHQAGGETTVMRYVDHYFRGASAESVGEHTMYVRRAFAHVQTKQKRKYGYILALMGLCLLGAGLYAFYEHKEAERERAMARELFYNMKALDLDIATLEQSVAASNHQQGLDVIGKYEDRRHEMEKSYDSFLATLHVYDPKMTKQDRLILRVARIFGECELDMPADFTAEVNKYIRYWQSSDRLAKAIRTAQEKGYTSTITKELLAQGLPPQYFYLALQESDFDPYSSGPMTRKGIAKGMWQFVPETAVKYGLRIGPLADLRRPDPGDDRHDYKKETKAASRYLKDLYTTDAQASGLLVMACYNWGEPRVLPLVRSMPLNPKERSFWRLLAMHRDKIPDETYNYVFYIVSAAVIGEDPHLFGFDFDNPLASLENK